MGFEGLQELAKFVQQGGALITEGSTSTLMAEYNLAGGVTVEHPANLFARGSILRGVFSDLKSPIAYGYDGKDLPVYFNQDPVLNAAAAAADSAASAAVADAAQAAHQRRRGPERHAERRADPHLAARTRRSVIAVRRGARCRRWTRRTGRPWRTRSGAPMRRVAAAADAAPSRLTPGRAPRVVLQFPANANDMLLSGTLGGGEAIANRALAVDVPLGKGHVVMFALRPFWRWQTQGTYLPGLQRHPELGSPGRRQARACPAVHRRRGPISCGQRRASERATAIHPSRDRKERFVRLKRSSAAESGTLHAPAKDAVPSTAAPQPPTFVRLMPIRQLGTLLRPVHQGSFVAPVQQLHHGLAVRRRQHECAHRSFVHPCRARPECSVRIIEQAGSQVSGSSA